MTNNQYGSFQTPSSRPPEPPYLANQDTSVDFNRTNQQSEFFGVKQNESVSEYNAQGNSNYQGYQNNENVAETHNGSAAEKTQRSEQQTHNTYEPHYEARYVASEKKGETGKKRSSGAGKTFLFGFLGALLACAIGLGGFAAWTNFNPTSQSASTTIGTTDSSVINAVEDGKTLAEAVAAKALPSVVAVYNYQKQAANGYGFGYGASQTGLNTAADNDGMTTAGMGSGVVISDEGYILTNYHVVENADKLTVKVGDEERDATYVGGDESSDVAVIKVEKTEGLTSADIGNSDDLAIGEWVMTVGAPLGLEQSVATGVISATNRSTIMNNSDSTDLYSLYYGNSAPSYTYYPNMIQTDAVINPGNSGGALVDSDGKLVGINTMISSYSGDYAGVGFAIPVNYAVGIAEQIIDGKEPTHAMLGVSISSVNASNAQRYGLSATSGAYIAAISEGTGAADSDLQVGDIITQIDDTKVTSSTDVTLEVREHNPGDTVTVTVNRNGETKEISVVLSSDENLKKNSDKSDDNQGEGNSNERDQNNSNGYNQRDLEELLKMFGM